MEYLRVKNFERFQHYKDRNPPWIKLHTDILYDYKFMSMSDADRWRLVGIWILASKNNNKIPYDPSWIEWTIYCEAGDLNLELYIERGFLEEWMGGSPEICNEWPTRYIPEKVRVAVFDRDNRTCQSCGSKEKLEIDHILPVSGGGTAEIDNLQVLCRTCNHRKRSKIRTSEQVATQTATQVSSVSREEESREEESREELAKKPPDGGELSTC